MTIIRIDLKTLFVHVRLPIPHAPTKRNGEQTRTYFNRDFMQRQSYTQDDLKQILQKIVVERPQAQKNDELPLPVKHDLQNTDTSKDKQLTLLKEIIKELHEKIKSLPDRQNELEEALQRTTAQKMQLIDQLKTHGTKSTDSERLKQENAQLKVLLKELSTELTSIKARAVEAPKLPVKAAIDPNTLIQLEELKKRSTQLEQELQEQKQRTLRFICDKKEIDDKILSLSNEKATLLARLRDLAQKNSAVEEEKNALHQKLQGLTASLEEAKKQQEEKEQAYTLLFDVSQGQAANIEELKKTIDEKTQAYTDMEEHTKLLEQHLARRVKECALFSKQLEEEMAKHTAFIEANETQLQDIASLQALLEQSKQSQESMQEAHLKEVKVMQTEYAAIEQKFEALHASWQAQGNELQHLKSLQARFSEIEGLFGQFGQILSQPITIPEPRPLPVSQKELFTQTPAPSPRVSRSLFD